MNAAAGSAAGSAPREKRRGSPRNHGFRTRPILLRHPGRPLRVPTLASHVRGGREIERLATETGGRNDENLMRRAHEVAEVKRAARLLIDHDEAYADPDQQAKGRQNSRPAARTRKTTQQTQRKTSRPDRSGAKFSPIPARSAMRVVRSSRHERNRSPRSQAAGAVH